MIWITGNSGSGKTTIAKELCKHIPNSIHLDGDVLREVWTDLGLSKDDRWEQNMRAASLAFMLESQGYMVVLSLICPYIKLREEIEKDFKVTWIKLRGGKSPSKEYPYEP